MLYLLTNETPFSVPHPHFPYRLSTHHLVCCGAVVGIIITGHHNGNSKGRRGRRGQLGRQRRRRRGGRQRGRQRHPRCMHRDCMATARDNERQGRRNGTTTMGRRGQRR